LTWDVGALIDGQSETLVIVVTVDAGAIDGTILTNTAVVQGDQSDPDPSNNTSIVTTLVALPAEIDLSITKGDSTDPVSPGANLTYSLTVAYGVSGSAVATGVFVMDTLPEGVTFVSSFLVKESLFHPGKMCPGMSEFYHQGRPRRWKLS
jgi:uncharacterized repeat protein (TIGR01451 family)